MNAMPNKRLLDWKRRLVPFRGVMVFMTVVIMAHVSWKILVHTGIDNQEYEKALHENRQASALTLIKEKLWQASGAGEINRANKEDQYISFLNMDVTPFFIAWAEKTAAVNFWVVKRIFRQPVFLKSGTMKYEEGKSGGLTVIAYDKPRGSAVNIIWGCTGVKQLYVFLLVILFSKGIWWKRFSYFILGSLVLLFFNIIRISVIVLCMQPYPNSFDLLHDCVFKYLFYGLIFLLWAAWEERLSGSYLCKNGIKNE